MKTLKQLMMTAAALAVSATAALSANIAVVGGSNDDAFWNLIKKGLDDATPGIVANGGSVNYLRLENYDNFAPDVVQLIRTAISQKVDGLVIPNWVPEAEDPAIKDAIAAGIKVILMNAGGADKAKELGAINYVGSDEYVAGLCRRRTYFADQRPEERSLHQHHSGCGKPRSTLQGRDRRHHRQGRQSHTAAVAFHSFGNATAVAEAIKAELIKDGTIDGIITISAGDADSAAIGIQQADKVAGVKLGSFDLNKAGLDRIKGGTQAFAIDQQPYLQGFLATTLLASAIDFGTSLPTFPVLTGPGIVDETNIDATLAGVAKGAR